MLAIVEILIGLVMLVLGGEVLVRGASRLAASMRISPLVIGLTVVAFGTSSPELAVSVQSAFAGTTDIGLGNVVGSNIFNVLFVLGVSALIIPLNVSSQLIRRDVPLMVAASVLLLVLASDGSLGRADGVILSTALVTYVYWSVRQSRRETAEVQQEFAQESPEGQPGVRAAVLQCGQILGGLALLAFGANLLVSGAVTIATQMGINQLIIGLTIVAVGTSLPEVVTSIIAAYRGERDIAVGSAVGSNLFNILCVLGLSSAVSPLGIQVSQTALEFDIPVMIAVAFACLPIFFTGNKIVRWEGGLFLFYYVAYMSYLVLDAMEHNVSRTLAEVMVAFVIPLTVLTLSVTAYRSLKNRFRPTEASVENPVVDEVSV